MKSQLLFAPALATGLVIDATQDISGMASLVVLGGFLILSPILLALQAFGQCAGLVAGFFHAGRGPAQVTTHSPVGS